MPEHNYIRKVQEFIDDPANAERLRAGAFLQIETLHDDWCGINNGKRCNCNPVVRFAANSADPERN